MMELDSNNPTRITIILNVNVKVYGKLAISTVIGGIILKFYFILRLRWHISEFVTFNSRPRLVDVSIYNLLIIY